MATHPVPPAAPAASDSAVPARRRARGETQATRRWEAATYWPLTIAAFAFLLGYTFQVIGDLTGGWSVVVTVTVVVTWAMFVVDYFVRLAMSRPRALWARRHLFDIAIVLLPTLKPVRLLTALTRLGSRGRTAGDSLRARLLIYGAGVAVLLIWQASLTVLNVERHAPGANITEFGPAVWWAFCTVTTVGYGDYTPVTAPGRVVAVLLMICGVVLVGLIVASFSSWVVEYATRGREDQRAATRADVQRVLDEIETERRRSPGVDDAAS